MRHAQDQGDWLTLEEVRHLAERHLEQLACQPASFLSFAHVLVQQMIAA
jgi:hypothetical protein